MSAPRRAPAPLICRRKRCTLPARWIVAYIGHPNSGSSRAPYCHEHAEEELRLLWDGAPRAYTKTAAGPWDPEQLRAALGGPETAEHLEIKRKHAAELEAELPPTSAREARAREAGR